jgi:hypothetical protein
MRVALLGIGFGLAVQSHAAEESKVVNLDVRNFDEETSGKTVFIKCVFHC